MSDFFRLLRCMFIPFFVVPSCFAVGIAVSYILSSWVAVSLAVALTGFLLMSFLWPALIRYLKAL